MAGWVWLLRGTLERALGGRLDDPDDDESLPDDESRPAVELAAAGMPVDHRQNGLFFFSSDGCQRVRKKVIVA